MADETGSAVTMTCESCGATRTARADSEGRLRMRTPAHEPGCTGTPIAEWRPVVRVGL